ncbi:unnamed protein product [Caenorhabditis angaria]|uniref:Protein AATF n=1 Tax=Caenorhabditis angaria TaxID=860376 RepID=A0A9P1MVV8_9PELO|nr:unnamed protein product [Caenorhabditis angaria]
MSLLDEISKLTTPAAALPDIEDDDYDGTSARKIVPKSKAKFPQINFEEGKYAGKKVSRSEIFGDSTEMSGLGRKVEDSDEGEDEEDEEEEEENVSEIEEGSEEEDVDDEEEGDSENDDEEDEENENEEENTGITTLPIEVDQSNDKAECIQNQRKVWDDIMYTNIRIHALLNATNQMPRGETRKQLMNSADEQTKQNIAKSMKNVAKLRQLLKEACECFAEKTGGDDDDDDEEIPSDEDIGDLNSDLEDEDGEDEEEDEESETPKKSAVEQGVSVEGLGKFLRKHDEDFDKFRATTITKWYNRTKLLNAKSANNADFSGFEKGSVLSQISKVLNDEGKLLKKVRTIRSGNARIGAEETNSQGIDNEIFDDNDFYQILLKQMIESRNNTMNTSEDGADMTRSYMELQNMFSNNKKKRDVTALSSKDRKLKYEPIAKLINFYPANPSVVTWSHESRNELFKSLFS